MTRTGNDWIAVGDQTLAFADAIKWATKPNCGAVVTFLGTVRDNSPGRKGVTSLEYEVFEDRAVAALEAVASEARRRWPELVRLALLHRSGVLEVGDISVLVVASSPHRACAFDAARFCIDTIKVSVPIWKKETWDQGSDWSECSHDIVTLNSTNMTSDEENNYFENIVGNHS